MQSSARYFTAGKKIGDGCLAVMVDSNAAADIMRGRSDGYRVRGYIDAILKTFVINIGKAINKKVALR